MKKNGLWGQSVPINLLLVLRVMKLCFIFLVILNFSLLAETSAQAKRVTLNMQNAELRQVFKKLKQQTGLRFFYNEEKLQREKLKKVDIRNLELDKALEEILEGTALTYTFLKDVVVIKDRHEVTVEALLEEKRSIKGTVKDESGVALPGVSVIVKGTQTGVATDINGRFEMKVDDNPDLILQFSFVGMETCEMKVGNRQQIEVVLKPDTETLEEVVCTGFQTISRERATGSYQILGADELSKSPAQNLGAKLEGMVTGMQVNYNEETGNTDIMIRGTATMNAESKPLIVVDGFPIQGDFSTINPNDIESVTVLKDAAAASIWGARAGNGVVVVVTRSGKKTDKMTVSFDAFVKFSPKMDLDYNFPVADAETQLAYEQYKIDRGFGTSWGTPDTFNQLNQIYTAGAQLMYNYKVGRITKDEYDTMLAKYKTTDSKRDIRKYMLNNPFSQNYNLSVSGRGEKNSWHLSAMYTGDKNSLKGNNREKLLINLKNTYEIRKWLGFDFGIMTEMKKNRSGLTLSNITEISPYETLKNDDGSYVPVVKRQASNAKSYNTWLMNDFLAHAQGMPYSDMSYNPLQDLEANNFTAKALNLRLQAGLNVTFMEGLDYRGSFQYERFKTDDSKHYGEESYYVRYLVNNNALLDKATQTVKETYVPKGDILSTAERLTETYNLRNQLNLNRVFAEKHSVAVLLGSELIWSEKQGWGNVLYGYNSEKNTHVTPPYGYGSSAKSWKQLFEKFFNGSIPTGHNLSYSAQRYLALYGNATYMYDGKYSVSASVRNDASNIIVEDKKYRYSPFWSVGLSWNISGESFMEKMDFIDRLLVRATYGKNGNTVTTASAVPIISHYASPSPTTGEFYGAIADKGNPTLRWEKVNQTNIGLDFSFLRKISGSIDYYLKKSTDLLANVAISPTLGSGSQTFNAAAVTNRGIELDLNYNQRIAGDLKWNSGVKLSYNKSKVTDYKRGTLTGDISSLKFVEGYPVDPVFSYIFGGMNDKGIGEIHAAKLDQVFTMEDRIGENGEPSTDVMLFQGTFTPKMILGWSNTFTYKGLTLKAMITGKFGHKFRKPTFNYGNGYDSKNYHKDLEAIMAGKAAEAGIPEIPETYSNYYYRYSWYYNILDTQVKNASHIRLREVYLGYDLPSNVCSRICLGGIRFYTQVRNLGMIWKANNCGIDPDYISGETIRPEISYTVGLNIHF